ncbi:hypothetical protein BG006_006546 [Podila minutissima]|uniref:Uncharacterized protein n=1 Tax=Podila minutissima TaxID=64525 RepID=A0A9P5SIU9_9FUNG|nr:hypothetical protein BG006_006546 [Podila minutissima]
MATMMAQIIDISNSNIQLTENLKATESNATMIAELCQLVITIKGFNNCLSNKKIEMSQAIMMAEANIATIINRNSSCILAKKSMTKATSLQEQNKCLSKTIKMVETKAIALEDHRNACCRIIQELETCDTALSNETKELEVNAMTLVDENGILGVTIKTTTAMTSDLCEQNAILT